MLAFVLRRLFQAALVMLAVGFIAFGLFTYVGDPVNNLLGQDATAEQRRQVAADLGLDRPFPMQYARFLSRAVRGEFGVSYRLGVPVADLLAERLPATLELSCSAMALALLAGVPLGVYAGLHRRGRLARFLMAGSLLGISLPTFLIGILLIFLFSVRLGWFPSFGRGEVVRLGFWSTGLLTQSGLRSLVLPAVTLALFQTTLIGRLVRAQMLEVLRTDYIRFARARGLPDRVVHFRHALRNTLVPVVTVVGLQLGGIVAFAIITETVFQWPGLGLLFLQAVQFVDVPVMSAYLVLVALLFVSINLAVDLLYLAVDPRLRAGASLADRVA
ncbi:MAG TPA: ABC transporter permease [Anaeromyxobacteraceae bacterium]|nr:ABC transporter permease [Anaeromyxobacteraceae bacterium]